MKKKIIILIKFIIAVIVFYLLLAFNIFHLGERLVPSTKDFLEINVPQEDQNLEENYLNIDTTTQAQTGHFAASNKDILQALCDRIAICGKIHFNGIFSTTEKYIYIKIISKIVQFIADNGNQDKDIKEVISKIDINKENGNRRGYATRDTIIFNL